MRPAPSFNPLRLALCWPAPFALFGLVLLTSAPHAASSVTLAWDPNREPDVTGYQLHYGHPPGTFSEHVNVGNVTNATVTDLVAGSVYSFYVTCYNSSGLESDPSNTVDYSVPSPTNSAPAANPQSATTVEDTAVAITLTATDPENDALTYTVLTGPTHGTLTGTAPALTYRPATNYAGSDRFTFKVNDGTQDSAAATVTLTVTAVNDAPVARPVSAMTAQNVPVAITLSAVDADNDLVTYAVVTAPTHGTLSGTGPNRSYLPATNYYGSDSFTYRANDGALDSAAATASITVKQTNSPPGAKKGGGKIKHNPSVAGAPSYAPLSITLMGTDPDGDPLTYQVVSAPQYGTLRGQGPNLVYTADPSFSGTDVFTFQVSDGRALSGLADFVIVDPLAHPPPLVCSLLPGADGQTAVQLHVDAAPDLRFELQASTNLKDWSALATNLVSEALDYTDVNPPMTPRRFYRAQMSDEGP